MLDVFRLQGCPLTPDANALLPRREEARLLKDRKAADEVKNEVVKRESGLSIRETAPFGKKEMKNNNTKDGIYIHHSLY